jgi:hypothetical protein
MENLQGSKNFQKGLWKILKITNDLESSFKLILSENEEDVVADKAADNLAISVLVDLCSGVTAAFEG